mgnify:CR=1 FL=1
MEKKNIYLLVGGIALVILSIGVSFAWWGWSSTNNTNVTFTINGLDIEATNTDIEGDVIPVSSKENGIVEEFTVKQKGNNGDVPICADFTLTLTTLPTELQEESFKYSIYNGTTQVGTGSFENSKQGDVITIATSQPVTTTESTYKVYVWIDGNMDNPLTMGGKHFLFTLGIIASQQEGACSPSEIIEVSAPVLAEGMIPVMWDGSNWVKADTTNSNEYAWYSYGDKKWANAVMVNETVSELNPSTQSAKTMAQSTSSSKSRADYLDNTKTPVGSIINEKDILAFYVWIPRYKYQLFNVNSEEMDPILIDVQFESKTTAKSAGSSNGEYLTHPAFTFGTTELDGIWVGKFDTSGTENKPTILNDAEPLVNQNVSTQFATSQKFISGTTYLTQTGVSKVDAHMMKNTEWGAVAYLKQSKYGLGLTDIEVGTEKTGGCSSIQGVPELSASKNDQIVGSLMTNGNCDVGNTLTTTSTTGNIYGVYDMAGGAAEYVMGVMQDNTNTSTPMSGKYTFSNSGFTGKVYDNGNYTSYTGTAFPSSKYYDLYAFDGSKYLYSDSYSCARRILGDATSETIGWYSDKTFLVIAVYPWFERGGRVAYGSEAGVFYATGSNGGDNRYISFRSVLALGA